MDHSTLASAADMNFFQQFWDIVTNLQQYVVWWVEQIGPWNLTAILFLVIFCETGLIVMPWLPGDSLLFIAGSLCSTVAGSQLSFAVLCVLLPVAAILGDNLNYWIGRWIGPRIFKKEQSLFFNAEILQRTHTFYEKHGRKTVILARFIPLVRTFAPFVAGVGKMEYLTFLLYGIIGAFGWVFICAGAGMLFGNIPWVKEHFEIIVLAVIGISIAPAVMAWMQARKEMKRQAAAAGTARNS